jgi:hypothetical protein
VDLQIKPVRFADLDPRATPVVHMTGTTGFPANPADAAALKKFIDGGGTLIADAAGASPDFRRSFEALVAAALGADGTLKPVPATSRVLNGTTPGAVDVAKADYRRSYLL